MTRYRHLWDCAFTKFEYHFTGVLYSKCIKFSPKGKDQYGLPPPNLCQLILTLKKYFSFIIKQAILKRWSIIQSLPFQNDTQHKNTQHNYIQHNNK